MRIQQGAVIPNKNMQNQKHCPTSGSAFLVNNDFVITKRVDAKHVFRNLSDDFIAFCAITFPAQGLKVILYCPTAFCHGNNVIYLKQKIRLNMGRVATGTASKIIAFFDKFT